MKKFLSSKIIELFDIKEIKQKDIIKKNKLFNYKNKRMKLIIHKLWFIVSNQYLPTLFDKEPFLFLKYIFIIKLFIFYYLDFFK